MYAICTEGIAEYLILLHDNKEILVWKQSVWGGCRGENVCW